ncbi:hypothetical protein C6P46_003425 [Rhodotorula mucilaginosa]|uniref:t-SNARE coiled-coil homology domain-containing protein n=1 Tax=Rhodotorula mucilaginosa TaxID=5537 RepID=A0A9P6W2U6_RHOMI|nr:hypothetical protein C6P46_003425 [Rhodotorula mucilaginosa]
MSSAYRQGGLLHRDPNRTALFGSRSSSPLPMYNKPSDRYAADRTADDIQGQNDEALEGLSQKVKLLKNNDTFGTTGAFLSGTMTKMKKMARRQGGQWCLWMVFLGIVMTVFFWTWLLRR